MIKLPVLLRGAGSGRSTTDPIWLDKITPAEGMKKVHEAAQKVLDKPRP